jgi:PAS domain-containing protein
VQRDDQGKALRLPGVILDITERVKVGEAKTALSEELARQERTFETVLSAIADFAYIFDREGRFIYADKALLDLWGLEMKDAAGRNFWI